jgi:hypothetical protein
MLIDPKIQEKLKERIDTKRCHFEEIKNGIKYTMTVSGSSGNYFCIDDKSVGLVIFDIKNLELRICQFQINPKHKGYGRIFYELLRDYAKNTYKCNKVIASSLTEEGNGFFEHMGLTHADKQKDPDVRWGDI